MSYIALSILPRSQRLMTLEIAQHQEKSMPLYNQSPSTCQLLKVQSYLATKLLINCE